jgi:hypothetical protein
MTSLTLVQNSQSSTKRYTEIIKKKIPPNYFTAEWLTTKIHSYLRRPTKPISSFFGGVCKPMAE